MPNAEKKGKKIRKPGKKIKRSQFYESHGDQVKRKGKSCPKCGAGVFMGEHKDRYACGNCHYMEKK